MALELKDLKLTDLIEINDLQSLQDCFAVSNNLASIILDPSGKPVTRSSNYSEFCRIVRSSSLGSECCRKVEIDLSRANKHPGPTILPCRNLPGILEGVVPIVIKGYHIASWSIGQVVSDHLDEDGIRDFARQIHVDEEDLVQAAHKLRKMSDHEFRKTLKFLELLSLQVSLLAVQNLEQKKLILERDNAQSALQESQQRLDLALSSADLGMWDWNIQTGELTVNSRWAEMIEYRPDEIEPEFNSWQKLIHPDDAHEVMKSLYAHLNGETPLFRSQYRIGTRRGKWKWVIDSGRIVEWDLEGEPLRAVGTHMDVSEQKEAEKELNAKSEEQNILLDNIDIQIWYMKDQEHYGILNQAHADFLGLEKTQVEGKSILDIDPEKAETAVKHNSWVMENRKRMKTEEWMKGHDGKERLFAVTRTPKFDLAGNLEYVICTASDITERREYEKKLAYMAVHDPLTGAYNRHSLEQLLRREAGRSKRYNHTIEFLMIDINRFKEINDKFGHQTGDKVLQEVATLLQKAVRECDLVVRYGGDEFLIVLPETSGQTSTLKERINRSVYQWNQENNILTFPLSLSIGCAHWDPESPGSVEDTLAEADKMMYQEKHGNQSEDKSYMRLVHDTDKLGTYRRIIPPNSQNN